MSEENEKLTPEQEAMNEAEEKLASLGNASPFDHPEPSEPEEEPKPAEGEGNGEGEEEPPATPAPGEGEGEGEPAPAPTGEGESEGGEEDFPAEENSDNWKKVRSNYSSLKGRNKELQTKLDEAQRELAKREAPATPPSPSPAEPATPENQPELADVFHVAAKATNDDYNDKVKSQDLLRQATSIIDNASSGEILGVLKMAKARQFGDSSEDVIILARDALMEANAREASARTAQAESYAEQEKFMGEVRASSEKVMEQFPELNDKNNVELQAFAKDWRERNLGKTDEQGKVIEYGPLAPLLQKSNWPEVISVMLVNEFKANGGKITAPASTPGTPPAEEAPKRPEYVPDGAVPAGDTGTASNSLSALEQKLKQAGKISS